MININYKNGYWLLLFVLFSCAKDLGNYEYTTQYELKIEGLKSEYNVLTQIDTLRISPQLSSEHYQQNSEQYRYTWLLFRDLFDTDTVGTTRDLNLPIRHAPGRYNLTLHVYDPESGIRWTARSRLSIGTKLSRGMLLIGENEQKFADINMLAMSSDTVIIKELLADNGLPGLTGPIHVQHSGGALASQNRLWAFTSSGSYYLDLSTLQASTANNFASLNYNTFGLSADQMTPVLMAPQITSISGTTGDAFGRVLVTKEGHIFGGNILENGRDMYADPLNRDANQPGILLPAAPYLFYPLRSTSSMIWFDTRNKRFMRIPSFFSTYTSNRIAENSGNLFSWDQSSVGRSLVYGENSFNSDGGATNGNSFAIMRDGQNKHFIYKFYANSAVPTQNGLYEIKPIAIDFDKASSYAFSSYRTLVLYVVEGKLYAYDYSPGNERFYALNLSENNEVTMIRFDTQIHPLENDLYLASYNATDKGTLQRFKLVANTNTVEFQAVAGSKWSNLIKIKSMAWRAVN